MVGCSAFRCKSRSEKKMPGVTFHRFPHDSEKQRLWLKNMKLTGWTPTANDRVCSTHFEEKWFYQTDGKKMRLLNEAVPTIFSELPFYYYLQIKKKETKICQQIPLNEPAPCTSSATDLEDTPTEMRLRMQIPLNEPAPSTSSATDVEDMLTEMRIRKQIPLNEPATSNSSATDVEDTPTEMRLRKRLFIEMEKSRLKSKKIKVLGQALKRCKRRVLSLKQLVNTLKKRNLTSNENVIKIIIEED